MKTKRALLVLTLVALMSTVSLAQKIEITAFGGYRTSGSFKLAPNVLDYSNLKIEDGFAFGLSLGYRVSEALTLEAMWSRTNSSMSAEAQGADSDDVFDLSEDQFHLNFLFFVGQRRTTVQPYVLLGLGATHFNPKPSDANGETRFSGSLGGGFIAMFSERAGFRLQAKWAPTYINTTSGLFVGWWGQPWIIPVNNYMSQGEFTGGIVFRF